jgi:hypothetical protein
MSEPPKLELDANGNIATNPVTGWTTATLAGIAALLAIEYLETQPGMKTGHSKAIQFALTPQQCLDLAEKLTKLAQLLIHAPSRPGEPVN